MPLELGHDMPYSCDMSAHLNDVRLAPASFEQAQDFPR